MTSLKKNSMSSISEDDSTQKDSKKKKKYYLMTPDEYAKTPDSQLPKMAVWWGLKERTTSHGIPQVDVAAGKVKRIIWVIITLFTIGALTFNLEQIIKKFTKKDVSVVVYMNHLRKQEFPAVTFCNMNPFRKSNVENNAELSSLLGTSVSSSTRKRRRRKRFVDNFELSSLLGTSVSSSTRKRRRRKRFVDTSSPTCSAENFHAASGYCYALASYSNVTSGGAPASWLYRGSWFDSRDKLCPTGWDLAVINSTDKWDFIRNNADIFAGNIVDHRYWIFSRWFLNNFYWRPYNTQFPTSWAAWASGEPASNSDCVYANINDGHLWYQGDCWKNYMALCEQKGDVETTTEAPTTVAETTQAPITTTAEVTTTMQSTTEATTTVTEPVISTDISTTIRSTSESQTESQTTETSIGSTQILLTSATSTEGTTTDYEEISLDESTTSTEAGLQSTESHTTLQSATTDAEVESSMSSSGTISSSSDTITEPWSTKALINQDSTVITTSAKSIVTSIETEVGSDSTESPVSNTKPAVSSTKNISETTSISNSELVSKSTEYDTNSKTKSMTSIEEVLLTNSDSITSISNLYVTNLSPTNTKTPLQSTKSNTNSDSITLLSNAYDTNNPSTNPLKSTGSDEVTTNTAGFQSVSIIDINQHESTTTKTGSLSTSITDRNQLETTDTGSPYAFTTNGNKYITTNTPSPTNIVSIQSSSSQLEGTTSSHSDSSTASLSLQTTDGPSLSTTTPMPVIVPYNPPPSPAPVPVPGSVFPERILPTAEFAEEERTYELLADIAEDIKKSLGYTANEFIVDCQYNGYNCYSWQFSYFYNAIHGNCYMFNSGWNESDAIRVSQQVGPRYGLKVVLNIDQDEYIQKLGGQAAGVRVVIHSQAKMPFPEDEGMMARTGYVTTIGIKKIQIKKLGPPYTTCFHLAERNLTRNVYEEKYKVNYTTLACFKTCYQRYMIKECGCGDPGYPSYGQAFAYLEVKACNSSNIIEDDCRYNITQMYARNQLDCYCEDPCSEDVYDPEMSETIWPSDLSRAAFISQYGHKIPNILNANTTDNETDRLRSNLAKVEVYLQTFETEVIQEKPSYTEIPFFTDVGSAMGLWIGWSLVTVFEFMEFFTDLIMLAWAKSKKGKVKQNRPRSTDIPLTAGADTPNTKLPILPRRSLQYIQPDMAEMKTLRPPQSTLAPLSESHRDSGISSASSIEDDHAALTRSRSRRPSRASRASFQSRRDSLRPIALQQNNLAAPAFHC